MGILTVATGGRLLYWCLESRTRSGPVEICGSGDDLLTQSELLFVSPLVQYCHDFAVHEMVSQETFSRGTVTLHVDYMRLKFDCCSQAGSVCKAREGFWIHQATPLVFIPGGFKSKVRFMRPNHTEDDLT